MAIFKIASTLINKSNDILIKFTICTVGISIAIAKMCVFVKEKQIYTNIWLSIKIRQKPTDKIVRWMVRKRLVAIQIQFNSKMSEQKCASDLNICKSIDVQPMRNWRFIEINDVSLDFRYYFGIKWLTNNASKMTETQAHTEHLLFPTIYRRCVSIVLASTSINTVKCYTKNFVELASYQKHFTLKQAIAIAKVYIHHFYTENQLALPKRVFRRIVHAVLQAWMCCVCTNVIAEDGHAHRLNHTISFNFGRYSDHNHRIRRKCIL